MRSLRPLTAARGAAALVAGLLGLAALCACSDPGGLKVSGPAQSPSAGSGPAYVSEGAGRTPLNHPEAFAPTETVALTALRWASWGGPVAEGTGRLGGSWCASACTATPLPVRVTLSGLVRLEKAAYYSRATVDAEGLPEAQRAPLRDLPLYVPKR
ncbi:hypothetical protein ACFP1Z_17995 [Streptomyces gamaensis]|uniref:Lipoprotein n=1 Tax=Streptomyces gamaensis TaxID=1763542 RepID=A0ABW0YZN7_9ACTN